MSHGHSPREFSVAKPYDILLVSALSGEEVALKHNAALYLCRIARRLNAYIVDMKELKIEMPKYRIKENRREYTIFEVIT